jgi:hypothetical protein
MPCLLCASCSVPLGALCCRGQHLILWHSCPCLLCFFTRSLQCTVFAESALLILWHSCPCLLCAADPFAVHCVAEEVSTLILCTAAMFVCAAAFLYSALCCRDQHSDPLAQLYMFFALRFLHPFAVHCVCREVSTLILWRSCPCFALLPSCSVPCSALFAEESALSDPLATAAVCFSFLQRSCSALCCRGQHSDPLAQLPMFALRFLQRSCSALCLQRSTLSGTAAHVCLRFLQRSFAVHCVAEGCTLIL